jgi:hypothetical protein
MYCAALVHLTIAVALSSCLLVSFPANAADAVVAQWIGPAADWVDEVAKARRNRFTYFRKVVELEAIPEDATLRFAADSNARLWINGHSLRRKVARYHEARITAEVVNAGPYLHTGKNVILVLHHNWGDVITFQRTGNERCWPRGGLATHVCANC